MLRELGITAVLNAAQGSMEDWNYVKTGPAYYQAAGMGTSVYTEYDRVPHSSRRFFEKPVISKKIPSLPPAGFL